MAINKARDSIAVLVFEDVLVGFEKFRLKANPKKNNLMIR